MARPLEAPIPLPALARHLACVRQAAGAAKVWATVEADACGHGIERCYPVLRGADGFAAFTLDEARRLRALGWRGPLWLRAGAMGPRDLELCSRWTLWHTVHCEAQIDWLAMHKTQQPHRVFLPLRVHAGASGFSPQAFRSAWARLNALPQVDEITLVRAAAPGEDEVDDAAEVASVLAAAWDDLPGERCLDWPSAAALAAAAAPAADWILGGDALYGAPGGLADLDAAGWPRLPGGR